MNKLVNSLYNSSLDAVLSMNRDDKVFGVVVVSCVCWPMRHMDVCSVRVEDIN